MKWSSIREFLQIPAKLTGKRVNIAVVDSSFASHPDITSSRRETYIIKTSQSNPEPDLLTPEEGPWSRGLHGLWTAAAAAGSGSLCNEIYTGAAPDANLYLLETGAFTTLEEIETKFVTALRWLLRNWREYNIRGVVLTVGITRDTTGQLPWQFDPIRVVCEQLADDGILVVVASGNTIDLSCSGPASSPSVLSVGGVIIPEDGGIQNSLPYHGCRGRSFEGKWMPEILAPAENLVLPMPFQSPEDFMNHYTAPHDQLPEGYARTEGTSYAGPIILGCAACIWEAHPEWTAKQVKSAIERTAVVGRWQKELNAGLIDIAAAVRMSRSETVAQSPFSVWSNWKREDENTRLELMKDQNNNDTASVILSFCQESPNPSIVEQIRLNLLNESYRVRVAAITVLSLIPDKVTSDEIVRLLDDSNSNVRIGALLTLSRAPDRWPELYHDIIRLFLDPDLNVRFCAIDLAAKIKHSKFIIPIISGLYDDAIAQRVSIFGARCRALEAMTRQTFDPVPEWREGQCWYSDRSTKSRIHIAQKWIEWLGQD